MSRSYGRLPWVFDPQDVYHRLPRSVTRKVPQFVDLSAGMGPQLDQGNEGSCGPNTMDEIIYFLQKLQGMSVVGGARQFIYYMTRKLMGTISQDSGVDNRTMLTALNEFGFVPEASDPYDDSQATMVRAPSAAMLAQALPNCIPSFNAVACTLDQLQGTLASSSIPLLFGTDVFQGIESDQAASTGIVPDPKPGDTPVGGHDISKVGYTTVDRPGVMPGNKWPAGTFKFRNHWMDDPSTPWGDGGYGYFSFGFVTNPTYNSDCWLIPKLAGGGTPVPTPPPPGPTPVPTPGGDILYQGDPGGLVTLMKGAVGHTNGSIFTNWVLSLIEGWLKQSGAAALPWIQSLVEKLPLPAAVITAIEALIGQYLGAKAVKLKYIVQP